MKILKRFFWSWWAPYFLLFVILSSCGFYFSLHFWPTDNDRASILAIYGIITGYLGIRLARESLRIDRELGRI